MNPIVAVNQPFGMKSSAISARNYAFFALSLIVAGYGFTRASMLTGVNFWFVFAVALLGGTYAHRVVTPSERLLAIRVFQNLALLLVTLTVIAVGFELFLAQRERATNARLAQAAAERPDYPMLLPGTLVDDAYERIARRWGVVTLPPAWEHEPVQIPGSARSYRWHEAIHVHDANGFRRMTPFPAKKRDTFRMLVVGDSLTYGYGIEQRFSYTEIVQNHLEQDFEFEALNLGVSGKQSEDILDLLRTFLPELKPDLVFYGVCLNDFLPSSVGEYRSMEYAFPLPAVIKEYLETRTRVARLIADLYDRALISIGLRPDFIDDILKDFSDYRLRFGRDVDAMGTLAAQHGGVPMVAMILHQFPKTEGRGYRVAAIAEEHLQGAGFEVIDIQEHLRTYDGRRDLWVSPWEGHPNELANALFASKIIRAMRELPALQPYRRTLPGPDPASI